MADPRRGRRRRVEGTGGDSEIDRDTPEGEGARLSCGHVAATARGSRGRGPVAGALDRDTRTARRQDGVGIVRVITRGDANGIDRRNVATVRNRAAGLDVAGRGNVSREQRAVDVGARLERAGRVQARAVGGAADRGAILQLATRGDPGREGVPGVGARQRGAALDRAGCIDRRREVRASDRGARLQRLCKRYSPHRAIARAPEIIGAILNP